MALQCGQPSCHCQVGSRAPILSMTRSGGCTVYRWLVARITRWAVLELARGRSRLPLRLMAPDIRFRFPGTSSFAADTATSADLAAWIDRFAALRPDYEILD